MLNPYNGAATGACSHPVATCSKCSSKLQRGTRNSEAVGLADKRNYYRDDNMNDVKQRDIAYSMATGAPGAPMAAISAVYVRWAYTGLIRLAIWSTLVTLVTCVAGGLYMFRQAIPLHVTCAPRGSLPIKNALFNLSLTIVGPPWRFFFRKVFGLMWFTPAVLNALAYHRFFGRRECGVRAEWTRQYRRANAALLVARAVEAVALLCTVYIMLLEAPWTHSFSMSLFTLSSAASAVLTAGLTIVSQEHLPEEKDVPERVRGRSLGTKKLLGVASPALALGMGAAAYAHHFHCVAYAHSAFAAFEYAFVLGVFASHYAAVWDFGCAFILLGPVTTFKPRGVTVV